MGIVSLAIARGEEIVGFGFRWIAWALIKEIVGSELCDCAKD